jgi:hydroxylamine dehydrogenase
MRGVRAERRLFVGLSIGIASLLLAGGLMAQEDADADRPGERLYIGKGCLGCHGASARGGVGPPLAGTPLAFDAFLGQLRHPRDIMPSFPEEIVSEDDAGEIHAYLQGLARDVPRLRADLPSGGLDPATCAECHRGLHPTVVRQFESSAMGTPGTQNPSVEQRPTMTCADCHGTDHDRIMASQGRVPETTCAGCHARIYQEHVLDAGHSYGPGPGDLGINWERNIGVPNYAQMPRKVMEMGCDPCHAQAGASDAEYWSEEQQKYVDTSSLVYRNGCIACHTRHSFSLVEARKPEACYTCHMGPDHPNYEAYMSSKHGSIYVARGADWDWTSDLANAEWDAPTCAYCHMVYVGEDGSRTSSHNMTRKIVWGMGTQAAGGELTDILDRPENRAKRFEMVRMCMTCHAEDKARGYLRSADAHKLAGDALVMEARDILGALYEDGLIEPSHGWRAAGLLPGPEFSAVELPSGIAAHWPAGLYYDVTAVEREYFDMFFFSNLKSYKGAFHMSPDYAWWYGYADVLGHLARLRDEDQQLREARATGRRTMFMLFTGPLMVLAVILALFFGWRAWQRRESR